MNRSLRAATVGVLLLSPVALSACSAGQVTQTATQERDKVGAMAEVGALTVRAAELESPRGGSYDAGDDAELTLAITNSSQEDDTLVAVEGEGFASVEFESAGATGGSDELEIPAGESVFVDGDDTAITLTDLDDALMTGQFLELTFTFENAGEVSLPVTVATPDEVQDRGEAFDFHHEEEGEEEGAEDAARERESAGE